MTIPRMAWCIWGAVSTNVKNFYSELCDISNTAWWLALRDEKGILPHFVSQGFSLPSVIVFPGLLQKQLVGKGAYFLRGWNMGGYSLLLLVALYSLQDACKWSTVKDCRSERWRHYWSLWILIPSCINQSDLGFPTFTTQSFHSGVYGDGLGQFWLDLPGRTSLSICGSMDNVLMVHHFPGWN